MDKRELKYRCYMEALEKSVVSVEIILNRLVQIDDKKGIIDDVVLMKDKRKTILDLELSENLFIQIDKELRRDMNSIIHSNRFEYYQEVIVYSQKGREEVDLKALLAFCHQILSTDKVWMKNNL